MKIYSLANPITNEIRYIGTTSGPLNSRLSQHKWDSKNKMSHKCHWIKQVVDDTGQFPLIKLIEEVSDLDWEWTERYWISQFKQWGFDLVNTDDGGKGVHKDVKGRSRSIDAHKIKVYQYNLNGTFIKSWDSIVGAESSFGISTGCITHNLKGRCKTAYGFRWSYTEQDILPSLNNKSKYDQYVVTLTDILTGDKQTFSSKQKLLNY
jgi:hypothetical protein